MSAVSALGKRAVCIMQSITSIIYSIQSLSYITLHHLLSSSGVALGGGGGSGVWTPSPAPTKATCGKRRDSMSFYGRWGRVRRAKTNPPCSAVSAIAELLVSL